MKPDLYPQPGDQLFTVSTSPLKKLVHVAEGGWLAYAANYKQAGDRLTELAPDTVSAIPLMEPIMFLYRHFLELRLKAVLALGFVAQDGDAATKVNDILRRHDLRKLTEECRSVCETLEIFPEDRKLETMFNAFEACIGELADIDGGSISFRYPIDKKLQPSRTREIIDSPTHLQLMMTKLENFLNLLHERFQYIVDDNAGNNDGWNDEDEMCHCKDISGLDEGEAVTESENE